MYYVHREFLQCGDPNSRGPAYDHILKMRQGKHRDIALPPPEIVKTGTSVGVF